MSKLTLQLQYCHLVFGELLVDIVLRLVRNDFGSRWPELLLVIVDDIGLGLRRLQWHTDEINVILSVLSRLWWQWRSACLAQILWRRCRLRILLAQRMLMRQRRLSAAVGEVRTWGTADNGRWRRRQLKRAGRMHLGPV